jgi:hypothetical protein
MRWTDLFPSAARRSRKLLALFLHNRIYLKAFAKKYGIAGAPCIYEVSRVLFGEEIFMPEKI